MPTVLVTGASQGIGRAVAAAFAGEPDVRLALVSRNETLLRDTLRMCEERGAEAEYFLCDVTDQTAVQSLSDTVRERWGDPDVLVNNAGLFEPGSVSTMSVETFRRQIEANLTSAFIVTHAFLNRMIERGSGHIFYMCSVASIRAYPGGAAYGAAKHGLLGLARVVREETKKDGLKVTSVLAGATFTNSWEGSDLPEDRFMPPDDVAAALLNAYRMSHRTVVEEILLRPQLGDI